jgi:uncharacterized protein involved in type VI secretion and phage assembly
MNNHLEPELSALLTAYKHCKQRGNKVFVERSKKDIINYFFSKHHLSKQEREVLKAINI